MTDEPEKDQEELDIEEQFKTVVTIDDLRALQTKQMLDDGWVVADPNLHNKPSRPPPLPPPRTSVPGIFSSKADYDPSHMWTENLPIEDNNDNNDDKVTLPEALSQYEIEKKLISGSSSDLFDVYDKTKENLPHYVLKVINSSINPIGIKKIWKSLPDTLSKCAGTYVVKMIDSFEDDDSVFVILEKLEGSLISVLSNKDIADAWTELDTCRVITQLLQAIKSVHDAGYVHGDISLSNILAIDKTSSGIKLCGFSKSTIESGLNRITCKSYMKAPEVVSSGSLGKPVDLWSLGIITYVLLTGKYPFYNTNPTTLNESILSGKVSFDTHQPGKRAQKFVKSLLAVDPKNRLTVEQALQNEWITSKGKKVIITDFYSNLQQTSKL